MSFRDRTSAGRLLGEALSTLGLEKPVVLGMARGGVVVAAEVARILGAPLDVLVVRKLGHPHQPELALGAIGEGGVRVLNTALIEQLRVAPSMIEAVAQRESAELARRLRAYRGDSRSIELAGRTAVVVDDGLATGATARAAVQVLRLGGAARVVLAVPIAPPAAVRTLEEEADQVVCLEVSDQFFGIGQWYADFRQVSDAEVRRLLISSTGQQSVGASPASVLAASVSAASVSAASAEMEVVVETGGPHLPGSLWIPEAPRGLVVFAHGSGSSRKSPRHRPVVAALHRQRVATLLFDLLTEAEADDRAKVFDVGLLGSRLFDAVSWATGQRALAMMPVGLFGASTGAAAAVVAGARLSDKVFAVVSRGGRPDLAPVEDLAALRAPTLLLVGASDTIVLERNRWAMNHLPFAQLHVVAGAGHLFEEPGALEEVADSATTWFVEHLR